MRQNFLRLKTYFQKDPQLSDPSLPRWKTMSTCQVSLLSIRYFTTNRRHQQLLRMQLTKELGNSSHPNQTQFQAWTHSNNPDKRLTWGQGCRSPGWGIPRWPRGLAGRTCCSPSTRRPQSPTRTHERRSSSSPSTSAEPNGCSNFRRKRLK